MLNILTHLLYAGLRLPLPKQRFVVYFPLKESPILEIVRPLCVQLYKMEYSQKGPFYSILISFVSVGLIVR